MKTVAVFFGGRSSEREISVITGVYAVNLLRGAGYRVMPVYLTEENEATLCEELKSVEEVVRFEKKKFLPISFTSGGFLLEKNRYPHEKNGGSLHEKRAKKSKKIIIDCALNCCHGGSGEGGGLSALLAWHKIPTASPAMAESAIFLEKSLAKLVLSGLGIPVAPYIVVREREFLQNEGEIFEKVEQTLNFPMILKPNAGGSSLGIGVAHSREELKFALKECFKVDATALIEPYFATKRDLNKAAYRKGGEVVLSPSEEAFSKEEILSFGEKYEGAGTRNSKIPAEISPSVERAMDEALKKVYEAFEMRGVVRADFLLVGEENQTSEENQSGARQETLYFNELNTVPGTLAAYLFGESLTSAKNFLVSLVEEAIDSPCEEKPIRTSGILQRTACGGKLR